MQEVRGVLVDGERDYAMLKGDTGPLVYPAGFVYVYGWLYRVCGDGGADIWLAQCLFAVLYVVSLALMASLYRRAGSVPPWTIVLMGLSKRMHSIYVLRLFNDPVAMFFMYWSLWFLVRRRSVLASLLFSVALSIKMNILLFFPALLLVLHDQVGIVGGVGCVLLMICWQVIVALPFLLHAPSSYLSRAFDLSRVFMYKWTVNWRMVSERTFLHPAFAACLLLMTASCLLVFLHTRWTRSGVFAYVKRAFTPPGIGRGNHLTADSILVMMFSCQLVGITFSRSLHYQFYSWYCWTVPFLSYRGFMAGKSWQRAVFVVLFQLVVEYCWNVYPSTALSSSLLLCAHLSLLMALWLNVRLFGRGDAKKLE
eukprot:Partr_v1_DN25880_c0_g1_i1_m2560 putative asparagine-linked glycosylation 3, alpha-1,3- mannosyltransferase homolog (S. cerevisiae)